MKNLRTRCSWRDNGKRELLLKGAQCGLREDHSLAELVKDFVFLCFMSVRHNMDAKISCILPAQEAFRISSFSWAKKMSCGFFFF